MFWTALTLGILVVSSITHALDLEGKIQWDDQCPDIITLRSSEVILDSGSMKGSVLRDGSFSIPDVPVGTYILSVMAPDHSFDQVRVDILDLETAPEIRPYIAGTPLNPPSTVVLPYPIILTARQKHAYFIPYESFNLMAMLSNPMMLMMVAAGAMMLGTPYLMKHLDPETMEEFRGQQAKMAGFQSALASGDFKTGLSAIMSADDAKPDVATSQVPPVRSRASKNKKR